MKRAGLGDSHSNNGEGQEHPAKVQRLDMINTGPPPPANIDNNKVSTKVDNLEGGHTLIAHHSTPSSDNRAKEIFQWIPPPPGDDEGAFDKMALPASKSRRPWSYSKGQISESLPSASTYTDEAYVTKLEDHGCFMRDSSTGPDQQDIALCERLLRPRQQPADAPPLQNTMFDDEYVKDFHQALRNRSEARLLLDLHPLLMPCAENQHIKNRGKNNEFLKNVIDGYQDPWDQEICGPRPQPDHARGLRWSTFSESQLQKLEGKLTKDKNTAAESSPYEMRYDMYFPYLTAQIVSDTNRNMEYADRANMHNMCVALRAVVRLSQAAGCPEKVHKRILGFSISHELEYLRIYGYYPEIDQQQQNTSYFRRIPSPSTTPGQVGASDRQVSGARSSDQASCDLATEVRRTVEKMLEDQKQLFLSQLEQLAAEQMAREEQRAAEHKRLLAELQEQKQLLLSQQEGRRLTEEKRAAEQKWQGKSNSLLKWNSRNSNWSKYM